MKLKMIKNTALVLCIGLFMAFGLSSRASAQQLLPTENSLTKIQELSPWTDAAKRKQAEEDKKKAQEEVQSTGPIAPQSDKEALDKITPWSGYSKSNKCEGAYQPREQDAGTSPNTSGMFSPEIMLGMQQFMREIYKELSKVLMIGHSLICYAQNVARTCLGWEDKICLGYLPNLNMLISGAVIYFVGVLMIMSIGMYFVDISFKLGFAVLFMPISIALWPFPPTKNKLSENLSIIIRNGMLFMLLAIGVTFAITLVSNSILPTPNDSGDGMSGWDMFWNAIANKSTEDLISSFSFDHLHFLVAGFGLIFAFKILSSSVNDYLSYFFSDSVFGSESPMHHMGTQAIGMIKANTVDKAVSFTKDVVKTQTGRAVTGVGGGIAALGSKQGRQRIVGNMKKFTGAVTNPRQTYNAAMGKLGEKANQAVKGVGSMVKGGINAASLFAPIKESTRKRFEESVDDWIDQKSEAAGDWVENKIAHGGGELQNLAADVTAMGINSYNKLAGNNQPSDFVTGDDVKDAVKQSISSAKSDIKAVGKGAKNLAASAAAAAYNTGQMMSGTTHNLKSGDDIIEDLQDFKSDVKEKVEKLAETKVGKKAVGVAEGTASVLGNVLKDFGESLQQNGDRRGRGFVGMNDISRQQAGAKEAEDREKSYYDTIDKYDES